MKSRATLIAVALACIAVLALVLVVSSGPDSWVGVPTPGGVSQASVQQAVEDLPPNAFTAIAREFVGVFEPMGLRLTRGSLQPVPGMPYEDGVDGRHLALYVEPLSEHQPAEAYLDTLMESTRAVLPDVFERWPGLESMDICQEPPPGLDDAESPTPWTTVAATRRQAENLDWDALDLSGLLAAFDRAELLTVFVDPKLQTSDAFITARRAADELKAKE